MTQEELKGYENRMYELKDLFLEALNKRDYKKIKSYTKELKEIKKTLEKANKEAKQ